MSYFVGAYATAPGTSGWDPEQEGQYYAAIRSMVNVRGLEHPFVGRLHPEDDDWFLANIDPGWDFVFTTIPGVMGRMSTDVEFGIASVSERGRNAALDFYEEARQAVHKLNRHVGRQAVRCVQIHTAPARQLAKSAVKALQSSLTEMLNWDWDGVQLVIEHCDAYRQGEAWEKGFLSLSEEIEAISEVNRTQEANIGLSINWGRSALEWQNIDGPVRHIAQARGAGLLSGLIFSGASNEETPYGVWKDTHMPPAKVFEGQAYAEGSALTEQEFRRCLEASGHPVEPLAFLGVKISVTPNDATLDERVAYNRDALKILEQLET